MTVAYGLSDVELGRYGDAASRIDEARSAMEGEIEGIKEKCRTYLNWYSPPYEPRLGTHDAWTDPFTTESYDLTRSNFHLARAVVDIWTALEASKPPMLIAEAESVTPPPPSLDQNETMNNRLVYKALRQLEAYRAQQRANSPKLWMRRTAFPLHAFKATRRKNLYGFAWQRVWPSSNLRMPVTHTLRDPTTVYPIWSSRDPGELEAVLVAYQIAANKAAAMYTGIATERTKTGVVLLGRDSGHYNEVDERYYNRSRTMVWVEEYWWREVEYDSDGLIDTEHSRVWCAKRVAGVMQEPKEYPGWYRVPWVYWENADERDNYGWSEVASVIDINDEFNRRLSQQGDIIGISSAPRFQILNSFEGRDVDMPGPFEQITMQDQERIEQILTRIDVFPSQIHFQTLTEMLHRTTGLPPIVWGLIQNAQTSGRALSASWKATEARLSPKLMRNEQSYDDWLELGLMYAKLYNWRGATDLYTDRDGDPFADFHWEWPPMEPRDFMEVTTNEITKRDAGLTTTIKAIRATGEEQAEETFEEVQAEFLNINLHPEKVQAFLLAQQAELNNLIMAMQAGISAPGEINTGSVAQITGQARQALSSGPQQVAAEPGQLPPTQAANPANAGVVAGPEGVPPGAPGTPEGQLTSGTLFRGGNVSNQLLETRRQ